MKNSSKKSKFKSFLRKKDGATVLEFSLLAVPFFVVFIGIFQVGYIFLASVNVDSALENVTRQIRVGALGGVPGGGTNAATLQAQVQTELCERILAVPDCDSNVQVGAQPFADFEALGMATLGPNNVPQLTGNFSTGVGGNIVIITVQATIPVAAAGFLGLENAADTNSLNVLSTAAFVNEAFAP